MDRVVWHPIKQVHCDRIGEKVHLEAKVVYPAEILPDQAPRVLSHRCSEDMRCNQFDKPTCRWAGTLPGHDPFA